MAKQKPEETSKNSQYEIELVHIGKQVRGFYGGP